MKFSVKKKRLASIEDRTFARAAQRLRSSLLHVVWACEMSSDFTAFRFKWKIHFFYLSFSKQLSPSVFFWPSLIFLVSKWEVRGQTGTQTDSWNSLSSFSHLIPSLGDFRSIRIQISLWHFSPSLLSLVQNFIEMSKVTFQFYLCLC